MVKCCLRMNHNHSDALLPVFPASTEVGQQGHLRLGGCDVVELASRFGTPLYVFDEETLRQNCRQFRQAFVSRYPQSQVLYASKAFINPALARIMASEGLGLDVVSGGELAVARSVEFPARNIYFHGNNKTRSELEQAVQYGIGRVVVDGFNELSLLNDVAGKGGGGPGTPLGGNPRVDAHTHPPVATC